MESLKYFSSKKKNLIRGTIVGTAILAATACGPRPGEGATYKGIVYSKSHEDVRVWIDLIPIGKVFIPIQHQDGEDWIVRIENCRAQQDLNKDNCNKQDLYVPERVYNATQIGDMVD